MLLLEAFQGLQIDALADVSTSKAFDDPLTSLFFCSSEVGLPMAFCWLSYCVSAAFRKLTRQYSTRAYHLAANRLRTIIFSTMARVSPSRSLSLLLSGVIFVVSIFGALLTTFSHHPF